MKYFFLLLLLLLSPSSSYFFLSYFYFRLTCSLDRLKTIEELRRVKTKHNENGRANRMTKEKKQRTKYFLYWIQINSIPSRSTWAKRTHRVNRKNTAGDEAVTRIFLDLDTITNTRNKSTIVRHSITESNIFTTLHEILVGYRFAAFKNSADLLVVSNSLV